MYTEINQECYESKTAFETILRLSYYILSLSSSKFLLILTESAMGFTVACFGPFLVSIMGAAPS